VEGEVGGDLLGTEGAAVLTFVQELDPAHPDFVVIEIKFLGVIDGVTEFDFLADIGLRHLVEGALKTDGGIVVDYALVADEEDLVELGFGEPADFDPSNRGIVAVDRPFLDAAMDLVMVVILEPQPEGLIEFVEADSLLDAGEEALPDGPEKAFHFSA
jgi:hypothetical protein